MKLLNQGVFRENIIFHEKKYHFRITVWFSMYTYSMAASVTLLCRVYSHIEHFRRFIYFYFVLFLFISYMSIEQISVSR